MTDPSGTSGADDEAWQAIVENYGERSELEELPPDGDSAPASDRDPPTEAEDETFRPPVPPPVRAPEGPRLAAWSGLLGVPGLVLILTVLHVAIPGWLGLLLLVWFVCGFGYLVATMGQNRPPDDGWDDGAVV